MNYPKVYKEYVFSFRGLWSKVTRDCWSITYTSIVGAVAIVALFKVYSGFKGVSSDQLVTVALGIIPAIIFIYAWPRSKITFDEKGFELKRGLRRQSARWEEVKHLPFLMSVKNPGVGTRPTSYVYFVTAEKKGPYIDTSRLFDIVSGELVDKDAFVKEVKALCPNLEPVYRSLGQSQFTGE